MNQNTHDLPHADSPDVVFDLGREIDEYFSQNGPQNAGNLAQGQTAGHDGIGGPFYAACAQPGSLGDSATVSAGGQSRSPRVSPTFASGGHSEHLTVTPRMELSTGLAPSWAFDAFAGGSFPTTSTMHMPPYASTAGVPPQSFNHYPYDLQVPTNSTSAFSLETSPSAVPNPYYIPNFDQNVMPTASTATAIAGASAPADQNSDAFAELVQQLFGNYTPPGYPETPYPTFTAPESLYPAPTMPTSLHPGFSAPASLAPAVIAPPFYPDSIDPRALCLNAPTMPNSLHPGFSAPASLDAAVTAPTFYPDSVDPRALCLNPPADHTIRTSPAHTSDHLAVTNVPMTPAVLPAVGTSANVHAMENLGQGRDLEDKQPEREGQVKKAKTNPGSSKAPKQSPCSVCGKMLSRKPANMRRHMDGVHGNVKYDCHICGQKLKYSGDVKRHIKLKHPDHFPPSSAK